MKADHDFTEGRSDTAQPMTISRVLFKLGELSSQRVAGNPGHARELSQASELADDLLIGVEVLCQVLVDSEGMENKDTREAMLFLVQNTIQTARGLAAVGSEMAFAARERTQAGRSSKGAAPMN